MLDKVLKISKVIYYTIGCVVGIASVVFAMFIASAFDKQTKEDE